MFIIRNTRKVINIGSGWSGAKFTLYAVFENGSQEEIGGAEFNEILTKYIES